MKLFLLLAGIVIAGNSYSQSNQVPEEVITPDSSSWTISNLSTIGYVNKTPGANYNTYDGGGGMLVKFRFTPDKRFQFQLYVKVNTYGNISESWTDVEGTVQFTKDKEGQPIFITTASKGIFRMNKMGKWSIRKVTTAELQSQFSKTYLWERTNFPNDTKNTWLLMVDLTDHPTAKLSDPGSIDPAWVSKFHIPVK